MNAKKRRYSKRIQNKLNSSNRNRFDRFGDDLCEEILQYLSFADKIRFECVSKQWKRCVFSRQHVLHIFKDSINGLPHKELLTYTEYDDKRYRFNELKIASIIEGVLKKCPQINNIILKEKIIWRILWGSSIKHKLLSIIADNCPHLTSIVIDCHEMTEDYFKYFGEKSGEKLKSLTILTSNNTNPKEDEYFGTLLDYCPNVLSISSLILQNLFDAKNDDKILVPKLQEINGLTVDDGNKLMNLFVERYKNTLKLLEILFIGSDFLPDFSLISKLTKLETLKIRLWGVSKNDLSRLTETLTNIGKNCVHVKHLSFEILDNDINYNLYELLTAINSFTALKYLYLKVRSYESNDTRNVSISLIRNCTQLKRISIKSLIDDTFFADVDQYLPQLSVIEVNITCCLSDNTINNLAKLKLLRAINIKSRSNAKITDTGICNLIDNCSQFHSFTFNPYPHITVKTIRKLMEVAHNRPKIKFSYIINSNTLEDITRVESFVVKRRKDFEKNLNIDIDTGYFRARRTKYRMPYVYVFPRRMLSHNQIGSDSSHTESEF